MTMCDVLDKVENRGIKRGIEIGIELGIEQGMQKGAEHTLTEIIFRMKSKGCSEEEIADLTGRSVVEIKEVLLCTTS